MLIHRATVATRPVAFCGLVACSVLAHAGSASSTSQDPAGKDPRHARTPSAGHKRRTRSPSPSASAHHRSTTGSQPSPSPSPSTSSHSPSPDGLSADYSVTNQWSDGFQATIAIVNDSARVVQGWQISITLRGDQIESSWDATWQPAGGSKVTLAPDWFDQVIEPGQTLDLGFTAQGSRAQPSRCSINGFACSQ
jgi:hypothetical protein